MMEPGLTAIVDNKFIREVDRELQRAERYSIFVSLTVLDLSFLGNKGFSFSPADLTKLSALIQSKLRTIDYVSPVGENQLGLLFPETSRQGAEIVIRRIADLVKDYLEESIESKIEDIIPIEVASYPDASGARSVKDFLSDWSEKHRN